jgi:hypothetical protein
MKLSAGLRVSSVLAVAGGLMAFMGGCQNGVTGPSLTATVQNVSPQPTVAGLEGGPNVCCCHLAGQITNTSTVPVDAELRFPAKTNGQLVGTAVDIQSDIPAGATRSFLAVGIPSACKDINLSQILTDKEVRLKGLWRPD